jgi:hypothetical protein
VRPIIAMLTIRIDHSKVLVLNTSIKFTMSKKVQASTLATYCSLNAKAFVGATYHGLDSKHLQAYLDEFCYRFNRRKFKGEWFRILGAICASTKTVTYPELVG